MYFSNFFDLKQFSILQNLTSFYSKSHHRWCPIKSLTRVVSQICNPLFSVDTLIVMTKKMLITHNSDVQGTSGEIFAAKMKLRASVQVSSALYFPLVVI